MPALAYFLSFRAYGTWLPGCGPHWTRRRTATSPPAVEPPDPRVLRHSLQIMRAPPVRLHRAAQRIVAVSIRETCEYRGWRLWELHVDCVHVHVVVTALWPPEKVLGTLKSWATRRLREAGEWRRETSPWARRGSTRYVKDPPSLAAVIWYVREGQ